MDGKRKFQFHLSTACVLMLVLAVLMWANIGVLREPYLSDGQLEYYGWPFEVYGYYMYFLGPDPYASNWVWDVDGAMQNIFVALSILAATAFGCEWWVRRRERKQQVPPA